MKYKDTPFGTIPENWALQRISEITNVVTDYVANGSFASLASNVKYKNSEDVAVLIRLADYNNNFKGNFVFIDENAYEFLGKSKLFGNEIIISNVGANVGTVFRCPKLKYKMSLAPNAIMVKFKGNDDFYYYWLKSRAGQHMLRTIVTGSAQPKFNKTNFRDMLVPVPPRNQQDKIASILQALDDKIELNKEINKNLEEQVHTLCNAWLNNFVPFGGVCPDDWKLTPLSSFARFISGYSYKGNELQESNTAMATIKNFDRKGGFKLDGYKEIVPSNKLKQEHYANLFDTLVAHTDLTQNAEVIGNAEPILSFSGYEDIIFSMDVVKVIPDSPDISKFLIAAILQTQRFKNHCLGYVNGTTVLHLSKKALPEYSLMLPNDLTILNPLDEAVSSIYQQMAQNIDENIQLSKTRDSLLPKLVSGEFDVSDLDL